MLWKGIKIMRLDIYMECCYFVPLAGDIDLWVRFAVEHQVEELNIYFMYYMDAEPKVREYGYRAPQHLNSYSLFKHLSLKGCDLHIPEIPAWNQLECLRIDGFWLSEGLIKRILLGCPRLEVFDLSLLENYENLNIQSKSLKRLKINKYLIRHRDGPSLDAELRICCPNLEKLELSGVFFRKCLFTNVSSLTDATLGFDDPNYHDVSGNKLLGETLRRILPTIQRVETLGFSVPSAKELGASHRKDVLSPLPNVKFLKLIVGIDNANLEDEFRDTMNLLGIFPNIKMLVVEDKVESFSKRAHLLDLEFGANLSKSFLSQLKTIQIISHLGSNSCVYQIIEFLLKYASALEKVVIQPGWGRSYSQPKFSRAAKKLLSMPRLSPTVELIFITNLNVESC